MINEELIILSCKVAYIFSVLLLLLIAQSWLSRVIQFSLHGRSVNRGNRRGAGYIIATIVRSFYKTDGIPRFTRKSAYFIAPIVSLSIAIWTWSFIPFSGIVEIGPLSFEPAIVDNNFALPIVTLLLIAYGYTHVLAGWSSNNKFSVLSAIRSIGRNLSIDLAMLVCIVAVLYCRSTGDLNSISSSSCLDKGPYLIPFVIINAVILFIVVMTKAGFHPFNYDASGREFVSDYRTEYSSTGRLFFGLADRIIKLTWLAFFIVMFMGGYSSFTPLAIIGSQYGVSGWIIELTSMIIRILAVVAAIELIGALIPRFKFSRFIAMSWDWVFPISIVNFIGTIVVHQLML